MMAIEGRTQLKTYFQTGDYPTQSQFENFIDSCFNLNDDTLYPSAGIAVSTGSSWETSITDNSSNWNTAYSWGNHASAGYLTSDSLLTSGSASIGAIQYNGTTQAAGQLDGGTTNPSHTTRLNYDGNLYVNNLYPSSNISWSKGITITNPTANALQGQVNAARAIGVYGISYSTTGYAGMFSTAVDGVCLNISQGAYASSGTVSKNLFEITRAIAGTGNITGNIISITDNPTTSGTISGKVLSATIGATERISLNPRATDGASAVSYMLDTHVNLTTTGAKLLSVLNNGFEKFSVDKDGNVNIPTGASYKINGITLSTGVTPTSGMFLWNGSTNTYEPYGVNSGTGLTITSSATPTSALNTSIFNVNGRIIAGSSHASFNQVGIYAISYSGWAVRGVSTSGNGLRGQATSGTGVYGISSTSYGIYGTSTSGTGVYGQTFTGSAAFFTQTGTSQNSMPVISIERSISGNVDVTGNIISIIDNPTTSGTISGKVLSATIGTTERISLNPRVASTGSAVAYMFDTHNSLTTGDKLLSVRSNGAEYFYTAVDGTYSGILKTTQLQITNSTNDIAHLTSTSLTLNPNISDGATAISYKLNTKNTLSTSGSKLLSIQNNTVERFRVTPTTTDIGDIAGGNYSTFESDGTLVFNGNATVFEDLNFSPLSSGGAAVSLPDYVTINSTVHREFTSANNQSCGDSKELPHAYKLSSTLTPHIHIFLKSGENAGTTGVTFTFYWELRQSTGVTNGSLTLSATSTQLTENPNKFDISGTAFAGAAELGAQLYITIARTAGDAGDVILMTYGVHYEIDTVGSRAITTK